jgi:hypothetical protein
MQSHIVKILREGVTGTRSALKSPAVIRALLVAIVAVLLAQAFGRVGRGYTNDLSSYLLSSQALLHGTNPYHTGSPFPYIYPLFLSALLVPLALMPYWLAVFLWFAASVWSLWYATVIILHTFDRSVAPGDNPVLFLVPLLVFLDVVQNNLLNGQVNLILLALCAIFLRTYLASRKVAAAFILATAIAIKLTPLVLLVYLVFRRDLLTAGLASVLSLLLIVVVPAVVGGAAAMGYQWGFATALIGGEFSSASRAGQEVAFSLTSLVAGIMPSLPMIVPFMIAGAVSLAPIALMQLSGRGSGTHRNEAIVFSLYMVAMLLISPRSETHHLASLFPALSLMTLGILRSPRNHIEVRVVVVGIVVISVLLAKLHLAAYLAGIVTLYASMIWLLFQREVPPPEGRAAPTGIQTLA